ncbi:patatin family protein [Corchorus olitorius]|uniref:Patatin family protein n=1 Tax=Corchorus olitorius TaxID=93759 RepID=A0A1R3KBH3_9ROSI|nr:patatin family protein [Corchorus olitorius]
MLPIGNDSSVVDEVEKIVQSEAGSRLKVSPHQFLQAVMNAVELRQCVRLVDLSLEHNKLDRLLLDFSYTSFITCPLSVSRLWLMKISEYAKRASALAKDNNAIPVNVDMISSDNCHLMKCDIMQPIEVQRLALFAVGNLAASLENRRHSGHLLKLEGTSHAPHGNACTISE